MKLIVAGAVVTCAAVCGLLALVDGCAAVNREVAKDQYTLDLQGCIDHNATRATQQACIAQVQATWTEAGAPPAAILDGGIQ